jgi:hypothetical protein
MKLQLKKVKIYDELSEETICFTAELYVDGKKVAVVKNSGQGGSTDVYYINGIPIEEVRKLEEYAKKHPVVYYLYGEEVKFYGVDYLVDKLLEQMIDGLLEENGL